MINVRSFSPALRDAVEECNCTKYDVFINHRGKDVKNTVASLVYHNLANRNVTVFLDSKAMRHGQAIPFALHQAIRNSTVHVAIFSKSYAESAWCLTELCLMEESGAPIIPIFFGVRPCDLRMENGLYSKALGKHLLSQRAESETIEKWRATLHRVSYNYGFQFQGDHGIVLEKIAVCVLERIRVKRRFEVRRRIYRIFCTAPLFFVGLLVFIVVYFKFN